MATEAKVVELPENPGKKRLKILIIVAASVVVLSLAAVLILSFSPIIAAKNIEVTGTELVNSDELGKKLEPLKGTPLPRISESKVQELIGEQPAIDEVVVRAKMPNTLVVEIIEAQPVAVLLDGKKEYLVSDEGKKLRVASDKQKDSLPKIKSGDVTGDPEKFRELTGILSSIDKSVLSQVSTAMLSKAGFVELSLPNKQTLIWGDSENAALKNQVVKIFLEELEDRPASKTTIDVTNPENPVVY